MASTSATWTPGSLQLRLALNSGSFRKSHAVLVRARVRRKMDREVRALCVAQDGEWRRNEATWKESESGSDPLAGWLDSGNDDQYVQSDRNTWFRGVVGAGVAGIVLVVGLSFAAFSISKRNTSRPKQEMETVQQEISLLSADETPSDKIKVDENEGNNAMPEDGGGELSTIIEQDSFSAPEYDGAPGENKISSGIEYAPLKGVNYISNDADTTDNISSQENHKTASAYAQTDPNTASGTKIFSEPKALIDLSKITNLTDSESLDGSNSDIQDNLLNCKPTNSFDLEDQDAKDLDQLPGSNLSLSSLTDADPNATIESVAVIIPISSQIDSTSDSPIIPSNNMDTVASTPTKENPDLSKTPQGSAECDVSFLEVDRVNETDFPGTSVPLSAYTFENEHKAYGRDEIDKSGSFFEIPSLCSTSSPVGIPAPSAAVQVNPGKIVFPAAVDQVQIQALAALQVLKVIETDAQPGDLCTRREYARWLASASSALSRNTGSKVYPAMYIKNVTELAFDDISPEDPDFPSIQGLAEAGLIASKLSNHDLLNDVQGRYLFHPESLLSRLDLITWKMALDKRRLPEADNKMLYKLSGFIDIDKINPDAWPALVADLSGGEQGIMALAFGCARLFQPDKPVTKAQAAIALASGEASDIVSEELARVEAESMAENAVSAHNALVAQVEKDINASVKKELSTEREKIDAVEKMAEKARLELEQLRAQREEENLTLLKQRAAVESEMEVLSRLRREVEEQLQSLMGDKAEVSYEKERLHKLRKEAEDKNQNISRLQHELEVERKALSMARAWAEDEAKRAREDVKALEEARDHWAMNGVKVVVDEELQQKSNASVAWLDSGNQFSVEATEYRAETLIDKLEAMENDVRGKSRQKIALIIQKLQIWVSALKERAHEAGKKSDGLKDAATLKAKGMVEEIQKGTGQLGSAVKDVAKRVAEDCREGVGKLAQKFKT